MSASPHSRPAEAPPLRRGAEPVPSVTSLARLGTAAALTCAVLLFAAPTARAHEFRPAVLVLEEGADGRVEGRLELPPEPDARELVVELPPGCRALPAAPGRLRADCGPGGLHGELRVTGLERGELIVRLRRHGAGLRPWSSGQAKPRSR
ncbi:hypothetical protein OV079_08920 [Nannocystis pusilla]|uniref:Uncharacterized protein n=1 Tax=Nannocystis pusilla TaxID=889268 RepID=A0A9X3IWN6_9BACT|nr:hypothetical protein [Nannocystis pusilla]MCY1005684.1 hypothetical protein [Nannocystis pusilla]